MRKLLVYVFNTSSLFPNEYKICNGRKKWVNKKKIGETAVDSTDQIGLSWLKNVCKLICMHVSVFVMIETAIGNHMKSDGFMRVEEIKNFYRHNDIQFALSLSLTIIAMLQFANIFHLA